MLSRMSHLADIFEDARCHVEQGFYHQVILGDLNTMAHGIARLSPKYCTDRMRFRSLGMDEAVVWERYLLSRLDYDYLPDKDNSRGQQEGGSKAAVGADQGRSVMPHAGPFEPGIQRRETGRAGSLQAREDAEADAAILAAELAQDVDAARQSGMVAHGGTLQALDYAGSPEASAGPVAEFAASPREGEVPQLEESARALEPEGRAATGALNERLLRWGLSCETAARALNPGFEDPFPASTTITLDNPAYRWFGISLMRGKLDWMLLRRMQVLGSSIGNHDYRHSDHKWLSVDVSW